MIYFIIFLSLIVYYVFFRKLYSSARKLKGNNHLKYDKLMIVTHPDDELIFGGRLLLDKKGWKVVCITNGSDNKY